MTTTTLDRTVPTGSTTQKATGGDYFRQFAVIFITLLTISVNGLANALPFNGIQTGQISDNYVTLFTPAGYVFAVWGVIYLGMLAYMVYQALPSQRTNPRLRAIGWWFVLGNIANTIWIFCWHWELLLPTVLLTATLLICLVIAYLRLAPARQVPGVVSRGYGRATQDCREVQPESGAHEVGDEPLLIARATGAPVFVAGQRAEAARQLLTRYPDTAVILCDDGLQHRALARDIEICLFDDRGTGNGFLLPAGPLREPWPRAVDFVLHTGDQPAFAGWRASRRLAGDAVQAHGQRVPLAELAGKPLAALAGIAQPEAFFAMLRAAGLTLQQTLALPDHYDFDSTLRSVDAGCSLICTEKDAVKLWRLRPQAWAVPLHIAFDPAFLEAFDRLLDAKLSSPHGPQTA